MNIDIDIEPIVEMVEERARDRLDDFINERLQELLFDEGNNIPFLLALIEGLNKYVNEHTETLIIESVHDQLKNILGIKEISAIYMQWSCIHRLERNIIEAKEEIQSLKKYNKRLTSSFEDFKNDNQKSE